MNVQLIVARAITRKRARARHLRHRCLTIAAPLGP